MKRKFSALLVHAQNERFETVSAVLEELSTASARARNRQEVETHLSQVPPPHLVVTEPVLPDGNWWDVIDLAAKAVEKTNVIVVSPVADIGLYMDVMSHGGFDFITDAFTVPELVHVLRGALDDAASSRRARKPAPSVVRNEPSGQLST
jgi:DNA-binding NtrC family response regulator